jgi:hypothetical protein
MNPISPPRRLPLDHEHLPVLGGVLLGISAMFVFIIITYFRLVNHFLNDQA